MKDMLIEDFEANTGINKQIHEDKENKHSDSDLW
jgi:hypothetical protein